MIDESAWIKLSRVDPLCFGIYVFRQANGKTLLPSEHHRKWHDFFLNNKRGVILAPPGIGKSVQITQIRLLWELCKDPNKCFIIISRSEQIAKRNLQVIRDIIQNNPRFKKVFPNVEIDPKNNNSTQITLKNRENGIADPSIIAIGIGTSLMGRRADGIIIDDCQDSSNCSKKMSDELFDWLQTTPLSRLSSNGFCFVISNSWNAHDIAHKLIKDGWPSWTTQFLLDDGLPTERSVWPQKFSLDYVKELRREKGERIFQRLYQNNVNLDNQSYFDADVIDKAILEGQSELNENCIWYCGIDLASRVKDEADESAMVIIHVDKSSKKRTLAHVEKGKWTLDQIIEHAKNINSKYHPKFFIEDNGAQDYIVQLLKKELPGVPIEGHTTTAKNNLEDLIDRLSIEFSQGIWKIKSYSGILTNVMQSTINNLKSWQYGEHVPDDVAAWVIALAHIDQYKEYIAPQQFNKR